MRTFLLILAVPAIASAQTTNTNCMVNGQQVNCTTAGQSAPNFTPPDYLKGLGGVDNLPRPYDTQRQVIRDRQGAQLRQQQIDATAERQADWAHVADLIKDHRCGEAVDFAIRQGGTEAGLRTKALCQ